ncbi:cAMP-binding protein [Solitalea canadensis DSM 3403]|uniref:cAMP-binding protein n=1 Tax=Solitalea canadensis (strain ATCC 29591 / DSM 3403 / JCM 21819 / LMG 8368 / NBRC 15130 / NCIMB 12057 / USAM 9D) TaxID=929556 RepID=H8KS76_SOLCM|nr:cAMP-binding protein [Solitalea canadensis DSM 3403]
MKECKNKCDLKTCFLCTKSLQDWLPAIDIHRKNFEVKKGQTIFSEGDPVTGIYFIYNGTVKVHKKWDKEKELIIRFAKQGDILGHLGLGNDSFYPVSTTALEPVTVCYLDLAFFETTLKVNNGFTYDLMRFFANELQESEKRMRNLVHMSVKARIAQSLITLKNQFGVNKDNTLNIEISRQDLASFSGSSYETLFKVMNEFTQQQLVNAAGREITIIDEASLLNLILQDNL